MIKIIRVIHNMNFFDRFLLAWSLFLILIVGVMAGAGFKENQLPEQNELQSDIAVVVRMQKDIDELWDAIDELRDRVMKLENERGEHETIQP